MGVAAVLGAVSAVAGLAGSAVSAIGSAQQGEAAKQAADYNAQVARNNATIASQNAEYAKAAGNAQAVQQQFKTAQQEGMIRAGEAANGLDVNSGSSLDLQSSAAEIGKLDSLTIQNQAARQAYGYQTQGSDFNAQAGLDVVSGDQSARAGSIAGVGSLIGGAASVTGNLAKFYQSGVFAGGAKNASGSIPSGGAGLG